MNTNKIHEQHMKTNEMNIQIIQTTHGRSTENQGKSMTVNENQ